MLILSEAYFALYNQVNILVVVLASLYDALTTTSVNYLSMGSHPVVLHSICYCVKPRYHVYSLIKHGLVESNQLRMKMRSFFSVLLSRT